MHCMRCAGRTPNRSSTVWNASQAPVSPAVERVRHPESPLQACMLRSCCLPPVCDRPQHASALSSSTAPRPARPHVGPRRSSRAVAPVTRVHRRRSRNPLNVRQKTAVRERQAAAHRRRRAVPRLRRRRWQGRRGGRPSERPGASVPEQASRSKRPQASRVVSRLTMMR